MKKLLIMFSVVACVGLAGCAKKPQAAPVASAGTQLPVVKQSGNNKFAVGPHQGLLGVRQYYFNCSSSLLPTYYYKALKAHAAYLKQKTTAKVEVQGYTSAAGSREYNVTIGQRRADAVANYLRLQGVKQSQIQEVSYGAQMDAPYTGKQQTKNCRVDLIYTAA